MSIKQHEATAREEWARLRLSRLVVAAYTLYQTTRGGIDRPKTAKQREIENTVAHAVVDFAADYGPFADTYRTGAALWSDLMTAALVSGELVRNPNGSIRNRTDPAESER